MMMSLLEMTVSLQFLNHRKNDSFVSDALYSYSVPAEVVRCARLRGVEGKEQWLINT